MRRQGNDLARLMSALILISFAMMSNAAIPIFSLIPQTATAVNVPRNGTAVVSYLVINNTKITRTLTIQPMAAVSHTVTASSCSNPFTLRPQQSCSLVLTINGTDLANVPAQQIIGGPVVCKTEGPGNNAPSPFLCSQPSAVNILRASLGRPATNAVITVTGSPLKLLVDGPTGSLTITNTSTDVLATNILANLAGPLANGGVTITASTCATLAPQASCTLTFSPGSTVINLTQFPIQGDNTNAVTATIGVSVKYAYFTNYRDGSITECTVNSNNGELTDCTPTGIPVGVPYGIAVFNGYSYTSNNNGYVDICTIDPSNGSLSACNRDDSYSGAGLSAIAINNGYAYIASVLSSTVTKCTIIPATGKFMNCAPTGSNFSNPEGGIAINNGYAYVTNGVNNTVTYCVVAPISGELTNCVPTGGNNFNYAAGIAILNGFAYVANYTTNTVSHCSINPNGALLNCVDSSSTFTHANGVGVSNGYIYIANFGDSTPPPIPSSVSKCTQDQVTGDLMGCISTGSNFNGPAGDIGFF